MDIILEHQRKIVQKGTRLNYEDETISLIDRMVLVNEEPTLSRKLNINKAIKRLKDNGLWSKLDCLWIPAVYGKNSYKNNWIADIYNLTEVVSKPVYSPNYGIKGNNTDVILKTGYIPNSAGKKYTLNNASLFTYTIESEITIQKNTIGVNNPISPYVGSSHITPVKGNAGALINGGNILYSTQLSSAGLMGVSRLEPGVFSVYVGDVLTNTNANANGLSDYEFYLLGRNSGETIINASANTIGIAGIGQGFTLNEWQILNSIFTDLLNSLKQNKYYSNPASKVNIDITTYAGTPTNEVVHPSVKYVPGGWNGYKYWMAITPYANTNNFYENPSIYCSNDGLTWSVPDGLTNPIVPYPGAGNYNADPNLFYENGKMYMAWIEVTDAARIYMIESTDGVVWGNKTLIQEPDAGMPLNSIPSIVKKDETYYLYYLADNNFPVKLRRKSSSSIYGPYTNMEDVHFSIKDQDFNHNNIQFYNGKFYILANSCSPGAHTYGDYIYMGESEDGLIFTRDDQPLISKTEDEENKFYLPTFTPTETGLKIYYTYLDSALDWWLMRADLTIT